MYTFSLTLFLDQRYSILIQTWSFIFAHLETRSLTNFSLRTLTAIWLNFNTIWWWNVVSRYNIIWNTYSEKWALVNQFQKLAKIVSKFSIHCFNSGNFRLCANLLCFLLANLPMLLFIQLLKSSLKLFPSLNILKIHSLFANLIFG